MPVNKKDVERILARHPEIKAEAFLVRYNNDRKKVAIRYTDINQINFDAAIRITVVFPERSLGTRWISEADGHVDLNRKRVRPSRPKESR